MIRAAKKNDITSLALLASMPEVWGDSPEKLEKDFEELLESKEDLVAAAEYGGKVIGFANIRLRREYVAGTKTSPVAYLEGIAVEEEYRGRGIAKELFEFCLDWAKKNGCREFASDCELTNQSSLRFHLRMGFEEANRIICFTKKL